MSRDEVADLVHLESSAIANPIPEAPPITALRFPASDIAVQLIVHPCPNLR